LTEAREKLRRAESRSGSSSDEDKDKGERPSEDVLERMEEKLEAAQGDQKNLFLIIIQV
jgi:nuclear cap-binding protein subunit 1